MNLQIYGTFSIPSQPYSLGNISSALACAIPISIKAHYNTSNTGVMLGNDGEIWFGGATGDVYIWTQVTYKLK